MNKLIFKLCEHIHYELVLGKKIPNHLVHIKDELDNPHDKENVFIIL